MDSSDISEILMVVKKRFFESEMVLWKYNPIIKKNLPKNF